MCFHDNFAKKYSFFTEYLQLNGSDLCIQIRIKDPVKHLWRSFFVKTIKEPSIKNVRKIFQKNNISNPLTRTWLFSQKSSIRNVWQSLVHIKTYKMESFAATVNDFQSLTIVAKLSILNATWGPV